MTKTNLLEKRKKSLEQKKNRLKEIEVTLNAQTRKRRTRHLIALGGLVAKAKLEEWSTNTLLGAFLEMKERESDKKQMDVWTHKGGVAFSVKKSSKSPVVVKFKDKPSSDIRSSLRSLGLKWNALRQEWEGYTKPQELKTLLENQPANIQELPSAQGE